LGGIVLSLIVVIRRLTDTGLTLGILIIFGLTLTFPFSLTLALALALILTFLFLIVVIPIYILIDVLVIVAFSVPIIEVTHRLVTVAITIVVRTSIL
jgi:hypothetical protein